MQSRWRPSAPVHKSPSLTVAGNWLATVASTVAPTVSRTICFQVQRKLYSEPDQVRRLTLSQAHLCCQCGTRDAESAAENVRNGSNAAVSIGHQWSRPDVAVIASVAKQSPASCAPAWGLPRRFAPRNDSEPAGRPPRLRSPDCPATQPSPPCLGGPHRA